MDCERSTEDYANSAYNLGPRTLIGATFLDPYSCTDRVEPTDNDSGAKKRYSFVPCKAVERGEGSARVPRPIINLNSFGGVGMCTGDVKGDQLKAVPHGNSGQSVSRFRWRNEPGIDQGEGTEGEKHVELLEEGVQSGWEEVKRQVLAQGFDLATFLEPPKCADCKHARCDMHPDSTAAAGTPNTEFLRKVNELRKQAYAKAFPPTT